MSITTKVIRSAFTRPPRHRVADHRDGKAELLVPGGPGPHPVAVVIHGGSWKTAYGSLVMRPLCADLVAHGWATWNIEYGRIGRGGRGGWPQTFDDVGVAVDGLLRLGDSRLDLERVVAVGHSAGGQLALFAGSRPALASGTPGADPALPLRHVVALAPVTNMLRAEETATPLLGGTVAQVPDRYAHVDPLQHVPLGLPVTIVHCTPDDVIPVARSREYVAAAHAAGVAPGDAELLEIADGGHSDVIDPSHPAWHAARTRLDALRNTL